MSEPVTDTSIASKTMPKVRGHVFLHEQVVTYNLICWLHGIRGKAGGNVTQAFMRNKGSHHRLIKPQLRGSQRTWMVRGGGGGLIRSSDGAPVMGVERRDQHVRGLFIQQPAFVGTIKYEEPISQPKTDW